MHPENFFSLEQIIERQLLTVAPKTPVIEVIKLMQQWGNSCSLTPNKTNSELSSTIPINNSCAFVVNNSQLLGIFTERDLVKMIAESLNLDCISVGEVMSRELITLIPTGFNDIFTALKLLRENSIRHLPVVDQSNRLLGLISETVIRHKLQPINLMKWRRVGEIMTNHVIHAPSTVSIRHGAKLMAEHQVSYVVIAEEAKVGNGLLIPIGIITERDIVQFQALNLDLTQSVQRLMSTPLFIANPEDSLWSIHQQMQHKRIRRLVVGGSQGELLGIITQTRLLQVFDPVEMYGLVELLQRHICQLEIQKKELLENRNAELEKEVKIRSVALEATNRQLQQEITQRQQGEKRWKALIENATDLIFILNAQFRFCYLSPSAKKIFEYYPNELIDQSFLTIVHPEEKRSVACFLDQARASSEIAQLSFEYRLGNRYGVLRVLKALVTNLLDNPAVEGIVLNCHEITDLKQAETKLRHDALHDSLTGLPNRALLTERLKQALLRQQRHPNWLFGVLFLDIDRFKIINDSLGHLVGDQFLIAMAVRLEKCLRSSDTLARLGGDEFVILLEELKSQNEAIKVAERIYQTLREPFIFNNQELFISVSIGITFSSSHDYDEPAQLLRDADTAMYKAKTLGNCRHAVFDISMYNKALNQLRLESDLQRAIERQELRVYYQPIISLENGCLQGMEALVRWQHPSLGLVPPADFISIAEETGLIMALDQWVLENSCRQLCDWKNQFPACAHLTLNVNLSGKHFFQSDLIQKIDLIMAETGLESQYLKLEITESVLIKHSQTVLQMLTQLINKKIQICLDDFGTGYSSLSYLNRFPINVLKIDRSFIHNLKSKNSQSTIVRTIIVMARELGIKAIAEGVETLEQLNFLKTLGCFGAQGYGFSPPLNSEAMTNLLAQVSTHQNQEILFGKFAGMQHSVMPQSDKDY